VDFKLHHYRPFAPFATASFRLYNSPKHQERAGHAPASPTERKRATVDRLHKADAADKESAKQ
jgi:hypothetical protein